MRYLRKADGTIVFEVEDHDCTYRAILIKPQKTDECVVCLGPNDGQRGFKCMHLCFCAECGKKIQRCPICRQRNVPDDKEA